jgi:hypothetical protein
MNTPHRTLTAADRSVLIRFASTMPSGSSERKTILASLTRVASRFPPEAEDFNKVKNPDGFWAWTVAEAERKGGLRLSPDTMGDVIFFLNMAADVWERQSKGKPDGLRTFGNGSRKAELDKAAMGSATVSAFLMVASSKLTQYDQRLEAKQPNRYRLGHLLGALDKVRQDLKDVANEDSPDALGRLRASLLQHFHPIPPINATIKQIDEFLGTGKMPRLVR